jgi:hypothetical protein
MTIWRLRIACWITKTTHTHTHRICNAYSISSVTMVARTRLCYFIRALPAFNYIGSVTRVMFRGTTVN